MIRSKTGGNLPHRTGGNFPLDTRTVTERVQEILLRTVGDDRHAAKKLARLANSNERTAKNWLAGEHAPGLAAFFNMAREMPELAAEARRLMGMASDLDPEFDRDMTKLITQWMRMKGAVE